MRAFFSLMWISFKGVDVVGALAFLSCEGDQSASKRIRGAAIHLDSALLVLNRRNHVGAAWFAYTDAHLTN